MNSRSRCSPMCSGEGRTSRAEAGAAVLGGHTITTERVPIYGMVAVGFADADRLLRNDAMAARAGPRPDEAARDRRDHDGDQARRRDRAAGRLGDRHDDDAERRRLARRAARRGAGRDRRDGVRAAGTPPAGRSRRAGARPCSMPARCRCSRACWTWRIADVVPSGTKRNHAWLGADDVVGGAHHARAAGAGRRADERRAAPGDLRRGRAPRRARGEGATGVRIGSSWTGPSGSR